MKHQYTYFLPLWIIALAFVFHGEMRALSIYALPANNPSAQDASLSDTWHEKWRYRLLQGDRSENTIDFAFSYADSIAYYTSPIHDVWGGLYAPLTASLVMVDHVFMPSWMLTMPYDNRAHTHTDSILQKGMHANEFVPLTDFTYAGDRRYTIGGQPARLTTKIDPLTASIFGTLYAGAVVGLHINQRNAWWSGERGPLHAQEDWVSALQVDKVGHAFGGYYMSYMLGEFLMGAGFGWETATQMGAGLGFLYQLYVEIEDGQARAWGFSPSDIFANTTGVMFFLAQHYVPFLQYFTPKWQYTPSQWLGKPQIVRPSTFIDDYNSTTVWLSADVYNLLPREARAYWPSWLGVAVGYGGDAIDANTDPSRPPDELSRRRVIVGLDINIVRLLPEGGWFWNWLRQSLNMALKLPAPAIEFSSTGTRGYLLYPFSISISGVRF